MGATITSKVIEKKSCFKHFFIVFSFCVLRLQYLVNAKLGSSIFKVLQKIGEGIFVPGLL